MMPEATPIDKALYCDVFDVTTTPWGVGFRFGVRTPAPPAPGENQPRMVVQQQAAVHMSMEHFKAMSFILCREVLRHERAHKLEVPLSDEVVATLDCSPEQWRKFWYGWVEGKAFGPASLDGEKAKLNRKAPAPAVPAFPFAEKAG